MNRHNGNSSVGRAFAALAVVVVVSAGCSASTKSTSQSLAGSPTSVSGKDGSATPGSSKGNSKSFDACTLATAAELSTAAKTKYSSVQAAGNFCNVNGESAADTFSYTIDKVNSGPFTTWKDAVDTLTKDDGKVTQVSGIGDRAMSGVKEFWVESKGYLITIVGADFNSQPNSGNFEHSKSVAKVLISKL